MNTQEKAQWLVDFYQKVADGGEIQRVDISLENGWITEDSISPGMQSQESFWRIKPAPREFWAPVNCLSAWLSDSKERAQSLYPGGKIIKVREVEDD